MPVDQSYFTAENIVQIVSCTECGMSWEHYLIEKPEYMITGSYWGERDRIPGIAVLRNHNTPCIHRYSLDRWGFFAISKDKVTAVRQIPYIPTLSSSVSIEFALLLIRKEVSLLDMYYDIIETEPFKDLIQIEEDPGGEAHFIQEIVTYRQRELQHYSYYEGEVPLHIFDKAHLRILAYLYQKNPIAFHEFTGKWVAKETENRRKAAEDDDLEFVEE